METRELTCIGCPMGCQLTVTLENGSVVNVSGNSCKIGDTYARKELTAPTRIVTSTVAIQGGSAHRLPVKTASDIPKDKIFNIMDEIRHTTVSAPIKIGDVVIPNVAGTGVDVIATKDI